MTATDDLADRAEKWRIMFADNGCEDEAAFVADMRAEVERLQAEAAKWGKQSNEMTKRAMLAEAEVERLQAELEEAQLAMRAEVRLREQHERDLLAARAAPPAPTEGP